MESTGAPAEAEVERIGRISSTVLRNLLITQTYHRLATAMREQTGGSANWCSFATWASRQAGQTIRGEDMLEVLRHKLSLPVTLIHPIHSLWRRVLALGLLDPDTMLGRLVRAVQGPLDPLERVSEAVARGNLKVFEEIGRIFARFLACPPDPASIEAFLSELRDGDPPHGQRLLRRAFARYHRLRSETDPGRRRILLYVANLEVGWHEQIRLQPEIQAALDAPAIELRQLGLRVLTVLAPGSAAWWRTARAFAAVLLGSFSWPLAVAWRRLAREAITESLMMLRIPADRVLLLRANLDLVYPETLARIDDDDAARLLGELHCDGTGDHDCGARDWADLGQRVHYLAHLFRALHEDPRLASPPFRAEQLAEIGAGRIPDGDL